MVSAARVNVEPTKTEYGDGMMADSNVKQADSGYNKALEAMKREETRRERNREHARVSRERKREHLEALQKENDELRTYLEHVETQADALKASLDGAQQQIYVGMAEISRLRELLAHEQHENRRLLNVLNWGPKTQAIIGLADASSRLGVSPFQRTLLATALDGWCGVKGDPLSLYHDPPPSSWCQGVARLLHLCACHVLLKPHPRTFSAEFAERLERARLHPVR